MGRSLDGIVVAEEDVEDAWDRHAGGVRRGPTVARSQWGKMLIHGTLFKIF